LRHAAAPARESDWRELAPKAAKRFVAGPAAKTTAPGEEFAVIELDLNDWFDVAQPREHRLQVVFRREDGGFAGGQSPEVRFSLGKRGGNP
jgi:hypothetical protein